MSTPVVTASPTPHQLRARVLRRLDAAQDLLRAAHSDLATLQGAGYCDESGQLGELRHELIKLFGRIEQLNEPTGSVRPTLVMFKG